ncbi:MULTISPECIES: PadR family transcriptional regulator [Methanobacterium]|jgi:DNA-binding PadR family transcriptional regulator|uniref:PadR family transcriptional regulator n=1 Tax=Methanobacterium veterum TaxID=408577 RepID=A0A9E5A110_9EURY|nr:MULTISPECIES: PadR family transcriptional regulator [Methanobacterium]MCZ3364852.1 PadR family transcriptional regulator [Methanobacterium veterum]MCZ3372607.1 PadR family transcriptional regulator [Methanobacterium veterum]
MANTDLIILGMIFLMPSHGYQLKKNIKESFGNPYFKLNNNVLYPTLARFEQEGFIEGKIVAGGNTSKKVYHITEKGREKLLEMVAEPVEPDIDGFDFSVHAVFFDLIPKESRVKIIKPLYESKLQMYKESLEKKEKYGVNILPISLAVLEYGIKGLERDLEFYKKLMEMD